jgi:hypothetical protein
MSNVVRLDNLAAVYGGAHIHSAQSTEVIENGFVGVVGNLLAGEREVREFEKPADLATARAALVSHDEIMYDQTRRSQNNLKNFNIQPGTPFRVYDLVPGDIYSVSKDAIVALGEKVVVGNKVTLTADSHLLSEKVASGAENAVADEKFVGRIEAVEQIGTTTVTGAPGLAGGVIDFVVIRVEKN